MRLPSDETKNRNSETKLQTTKTPELQTRNNTTESWTLLEMITCRDGQFTVGSHSFPNCTYKYRRASVTFLSGLVITELSSDWLTLHSIHAADMWWTFFPVKTLFLLFPLRTENQNVENCLTALSYFHKRRRNQQSRLTTNKLWITIIFCSSYKLFFSYVSIKRREQQRKKSSKFWHLKTWNQQMFGIFTWTFI